MTNRLMQILIVVLLIWNISLTGSLSMIKNKETGENNTTTVQVDGFSTDFTQIVERNRTGVVSVSADGFISSGFVYSQNDEDVYVVTAFHGVENCFKIDVIFDNDYRTNAEVVGFDIYSDLAVLKVNSPYQMTVLTKGVSESLSAGEFLVSVGTRGVMDYPNSVELGMVSNKLRTVLNVVEYEDFAYEYYSSLIQLTSSLSNGFSGGPLFNMNGEVVGIVTMAKDNDSIFAFPIDEASYVIDSIINNTYVSKIRLGLKGSYISQMPTYKRSALSLSLDQSEGYYVEKMTNNSYAYLFGIREGDIILSVNDVVIRDNRDLLKVSYSGANSLEFRVLRAGEKITITGAVND